MSWLRNAAITALRFFGIGLALIIAAMLSLKLLFWFFGAVGWSWVLLAVLFLLLVGILGWGWWENRLRDAAGAIVGATYIGVTLLLLVYGYRLIVGGMLYAFYNAEHPDAPLTPMREHWWVFKEVWDNPIFGLMSVVDGEIMAWMKTPWGMTLMAINLGALLVLASRILATPNDPPRPGWAQWFHTGMRDTAVWLGLAHRPGTTTPDPHAPPPNPPAVPPPPPASPPPTPVPPPSGPPPAGSPGAPPVPPPVGAPPPAPGAPPPLPPAPPAGPTPVPPASPLPGAPPVPGAAPAPPPPAAPAAGHAPVAPHPPEKWWATAFTTLNIAAASIAFVMNWVVWGYGGQALVHAAVWGGIFTTVALADLVKKYFMHPNDGHDGTVRRKDLQKTIWAFTGVLIAQVLVLLMAFGYESFVRTTIVMQDDRCMMLRKKHRVANREFLAVMGDEARYDIDGVFDPMPSKGMCWTAVGLKTPLCREYLHACHPEWREYTWEEASVLFDQGVEKLERELAARP